jgi:hypothetical protein
MVAMTDSYKHTDRLIDDALALVRSALRDDHFDFNTTSRQNPLATVESNVVISEHADGRGLDVSLSSLEMVTSVLQVRSPPRVQTPESVEILPDPDRSYQHDSSAIETTTGVETGPVPEFDLGPPIQRASHSSTHQESWLDTERANLRERAAAFRETQLRFQREREAYYTATMAACRANEWKPIH